MSNSDGDQFVSESNFEELVALAKCLDCVWTENYHPCDCRFRKTPEGKARCDELLAKQELRNSKDGCQSSNEQGRSGQPPNRPWLDDDCERNVVASANKISFRNPSFEPEAQKNQQASFDDSQAQSLEPGTNKDNQKEDEPLIDTKQPAEPEPGRVSKDSAAPGSSRNSENKDVPSSSKNPDTAPTSNRNSANSSNSPNSSRNSENPDSESNAASARNSRVSYADSKVQSPASSPRSSMKQSRGSSSKPPSTPSSRKGTQTDSKIAIHARKSSKLQSGRASRKQSHFVDDSNKSDAHFYALNSELPEDLDQIGKGISQIKGKGTVTSSRNHYFHSRASSKANINRDSLRGSKKSLTTGSFPSKSHIPKNKSQQLKSGRNSKKTSVSSKPPSLKNIHDDPETQNFDEHRQSNPQPLPLKPRKTPENIPDRPFVTDSIYNDLVDLAQISTTQWNKNYHPCYEENPEAYGITPHHNCAEINQRFDTDEPPPPFPSKNRGSAPESTDIDPPVLMSEDNKPKKPSQPPEPEQATTDEPPVETIHKIADDTALETPDSSEEVGAAPPGDSPRQSTEEAIRKGRLVRISDSVYHELLQRGKIHEHVEE